MSRLIDADAQVMERCQRCKYQNYMEFDACHICNNEKDMFRPRSTYADRIRAMTDEELAEWINKHDCHTNLYGYDPKEAILEWLKQEVQDAID